MNKVVVMGNLTQDLIVKRNDSSVIVRGLIAVNRTKDESDFFKFVAFSRSATYLSSYAVKGSKVLIDGNLQSSKYVDKDGKNQYVVEIIVDRVWVLSKEKIQAVTSKPKDYVDENKSDREIDLDIDLPF